MMRRKECPGCGFQFVSLRRTSKYCSTRCRMRLHRYLNRPAIVAERKAAERGQEAIKRYARDRSVTPPAGAATSSAGQATIVADVSHPFERLKGKKSTGSTKGGDA